MREHSLVVLTRPVPEHGLEPGDIGTVVHRYRDGRAFEVEFAGAGARSVTVLTLEPTDLRDRGQPADPQPSGTKPAVAKCRSSVSASVMPRLVMTAKLTASVKEKS